MPRVWIDGEAQVYEYADSAAIQGTGLDTQERSLTMQFYFAIGRTGFKQAGFSVETLRTPAEEARRAKHRQGGDTYTNCSFERPFPIVMPAAPPPEIKGNRAEAIDRAHNLTGLDREIVERVWDEIQRYYKDKNAPPKEGDAE